MNQQQTKKFCMQLPHVSEQLFGEPSNILVYSLHEKKFAYFKTSEPEQWRFSVRVSPDRFLELTDQPGIKPARYMGRFHWITVVDVNQMDKTYLQTLIRDSYLMALRSLPKKLQSEIKKDAGNASL